MSQKVEEIADKKETAKQKAKTPQEKLAEYLATHNVKIARTPEELYGQKTDQTQEEIEAEVDDFLRLREEWRKENRERNYDL